MGCWMAVWSIQKRDTERGEEREKDGECAIRHVALHTVHQQNGSDKLKTKRKKSSQNTNRLNLLSLLSDQDSRLLITHCSRQMSIGLHVF